MSRSGFQPSVPVTGAAPLDWNHLERATMGDPDLAREVLALFAAQATVLSDAIHDLPPDAAALTHKLKGAARGIGAWAVAEAAEQVEAALLSMADARPAADRLARRIGEACDAIANRSCDLRRSPAPNAGAAQSDSL